MPSKHYYVFGDEGAFDDLNKEAWDALRIGNANPDFRFETSAEEYASACLKRTDCRAVAEVVLDCLHIIGGESMQVVSLGAGKGIVEWHLKHMAPDIRMICTDYAEAGVDRLRRLFVECDQVTTFDMLKDDYGRFSKDSVLLMNRVSTEFDQFEWRRIFRSCRGAGIRHILYIPTEFATFRLKVAEAARHALRRILRRCDTFCGWLYGRRELELMMTAEYEICAFRRLGNGGVYMLKSRK